ncbi:MAG: hypothetical protein EBY49_06355 [Actinobacteria bacterium]|nr:hypothetical protein [Actinomycetota bacterium]
MSIPRDLLVFDERGEPRKLTELFAGGPDPLLRSQQLDVAGAEQRERPSLAESFRKLVTHRLAAIAVFAMAVGQGVMVAVMTVTPLHMDEGAHEARVIGLVISLHIVGMYFFSPLVEAEEVSGDPAGAAERDRRAQHRTDRSRPDDDADLSGPVRLLGEVGGGVAGSEVCGLPDTDPEHPDQQEEVDLGDDGEEGEERAECADHPGSEVVAAKLAVMPIPAGNTELISAHRVRRRISGSSTVRSVISREPAILPPGTRRGFGPHRRLCRCRSTSDSHQPAHRHSGERCGHLESHPAGPSQCWVPSVLRKGRQPASRPSGQPPSADDRSFRVR